MVAITELSKSQKYKNMKYPRTYHLPFSEGLQNDDRRVESIERLIGVPIVMTEKLDGSNTCHKQSGVYGRSHAEPTKNPWMRNVLDLYYEKVKDALSDGVEIFGENLYGVHSIEYSGLGHHFYMFGVRDNTEWISWDDVEFYSEVLDIPTVPVLHKGVFNSPADLKEAVGHYMAEPSVLSDESLFHTPKEGIVVRARGYFANGDFATHVAKFVRKGHVQTDEHWTRNWKRASLHYELLRMKRR